MLILSFKEVILLNYAENCSENEKKYPFCPSNPFFIYHD